MITMAQTELGEEPGCCVAWAAAPLFGVYAEVLCPAVSARGPGGGVMNPGVKRPEGSKEYFTPEQCYILEVSNSPDDEACSIARARVKPGVTTHWHRVRDTAERYVILQGRGRVEVGDLPPQDVGPATWC